MSALTPYQKIMEAARRGNGLTLTSVEVWELSLNEEISLRASCDDDWKTPPSRDVNLYRLEERKFNKI